MARVLAFSLSTPGHVFPFVPILHELQRRGHEVVLGVPSAAPLPAEIAGVPVHCGSWDASDGSGQLAPRALPTAEAAQLRTYEAHGEPLAALLARMIAQYHPDFLLIDPMLWGAMIAAEASGLPWAALAHNPLMIRGRGLDVRGPGLPLPHGPLQRFAHRIYGAAQRVAHERYLPALNAARARLELSPLSHPWDLCHIAPLTLATTAEPFEYPRTDWDPSVRFIGPLAWDPPGELPSWISELDDRPIIVFAGSTIPEAGEALPWSLIALPALAETPVQVIATIPAGPLPERLPDNVRVERFVPHAQLLPLAACLVCHGGPGITLKALASGVPVVAIPSAYDRYEVARRVEVARAGVMLPRKRLTPARLTAAVQRARQCKPGADRVAATFHSAGGAPAAVDSVGALLSSRQVSSLVATEGA